MASDFKSAFVSIKEVFGKTWEVIKIALASGDLAGSVVPPLTQYAVRIRSTIPIVCQFGRLDTTQNAMSYYDGIGYAE